YHGPHGLKAAGKSGVKRWAKNHARKDPSALIDQIFEALAQQSVVVPGAATVELIIPRVAAQIKEFKAQRALVATEVEAMVDAHPLTQVLISMPGVGIKTAATILLTAGDFSSFPTPATSRLTPGSHPSRDALGPQSEANSLPGQATNSSKMPSSDQPGWPPATTQHPRPVTIRNVLKARNTTPRSSALPAADSTSCSPWSEMVASTNQ